MNTGVSQVFIEGVPRRRFGYFAAAGKVTSVLLKIKIIHIFQQKCG